MTLAATDLAAFSAALTLIERDSHLDRWRADPVAWVQERLGEHVWSKQAEVMRAVAANPRVTVQSAHSTGKSHLASRLVAWFLSVHPPEETFVVTTAPSAAQVRAILWRYIAQVHSKHGLDGRVTQSAEWKINDQLVAYGRKPSDYVDSNFSGIHAKHMLVILDEACGVAKNLWVAADSLTTSADCHTLAIGNPDNSTSHFARVCTTEPGWVRHKISAYDSPAMTGEPVPQLLLDTLVNEEWILDKKLRWGEDSPVYRAKVLGEFSTDDPGKVVRGSDVAACRLGIDAPRTDTELRPVELGVDVGGGGDETVIRERRGPVAGREWAERSDQPSDIAPMILRAIRETGATTVKIDSIGVGAGLVGELVNLGHNGVHNARIVPVNVSNASREPDVYENVRAEMWWMAREMSQNGEWDLSTMDNADDTVAQLLEPGWSINTRGRIQIEKKDPDIRQRLGRSPDNADALLLAFYTPPHGHAAAQDWLSGYKDAMRRTA